MRIAGASSAKGCLTFSPIGNLLDQKLAVGNVNDADNKSVTMNNSHDALPFQATMTVERLKVGYSL